MIQHRCKPLRQPSAQDLRSKTWVTSLSTAGHAYHTRHICPYYFNGPVQVRDIHPSQTQHVSLQTLIPTDGARLPLRPRAHRLPTPHMNGKKRLPEPPRHPTIRCSVHAPIRLYNVEHTRFCSGQSDRGPPSCSQESRAISEGNTGAAHDVAGGGERSQPPTHRLRRCGLGE
jgi:hypothetical protein